MNEQDLLNKAQLIAGLVALVLPTARTIGVAVTDLLDFIRAQSTEAGDNAQLAKNAAEFLELKAGFQEEANRTV